MVIFKKTFVVCLMVIFSMAFIQVCQANAKEAVSLIVINNSKEPFGDQLKNEVCTQLEKQLRVHSNDEQGMQETMRSLGFEVSKAEKPELAMLAEKLRVNKVVVVEILPAMIEYNQMVFCQTIKAEATLRVRLYDAEKKQYTLIEDISGNGSNKTFIPYTSIGTKPAVLEAAHKAVVATAERISKSLQ